MSPKNQIMVLLTATMIAACSAESNLDESIAEETENVEEAVSGYAFNGTLSSTFDSDEEGWKVNFFNEFGGYDAPWDSASQSITITDLTDGDTWQYTAPWRGNMSNYYGATMSFDIKDVFLGTGGSGARNANSQGLQLISKDWSIVLNYPLSAPIGNDSYSVPFSQDGKWWKTGSSTLPTKADFQEVLKNLGYIRIVAEYVDGNDTSYLDNVSIVPAQL